MSVELFRAMEKRRMYRQYLSDLPTDDQLEQLVYAAGRAPAARDKIRHLVVVTDKATMNAIRIVAPGFYNNAPALIAVCADLEVARWHTGDASLETAILDCGAAGAYLSLAAPALGLGIGWVTSWSPPPVQAVLGLPPHVRPFLLVAVGIPAPNAKRAPKRFEPTVHRHVSIA